MGAGVWMTQPKTPPPFLATVFIAFAIECTVPLTPSPAEWARHTLHKYIYQEGMVGFWKVWLAFGRCGWLW
ncbi:hypothetical protein B0H65DRAFT_459456 [Neurospora tetraspora]|uniref:Uncharacterized protein n=1 Tax=Neurospora tetraspora TaxID=94610 RepID=A0AAE0MWB3_9PEZI|nr:hypothetical protein B0H65DRAFT_459456 [Neurospora tetraspora]